MQTSEEIEKRLRRTEKELRITKARFLRYDDHDDMTDIPVLKREVNILRWVLMERR